MIISFSVENWMSFRDSVTFSMVASRERHHVERRELRRDVRRVDARDEVAHARVERQRRVAEGEGVERRLARARVERLRRGRHRLRERRRQAKKHDAETETHFCLFLSHWRARQQRDLSARQLESKSG